VGAILGPVSRSGKHRTIAFRGMASHCHNVTGTKVIKPGFRAEKAGFIARPGNSRKIADAFLRPIDGLLSGSDDEAVESLSLCVLVGLGRGQRLTIYLTYDFVGEVDGALIAVSTARRYTFLQPLNSPMDWGGFAYGLRSLCAFP
jgi:hypothetical protein